MSSKNIENRVAQQVLLFNFYQEVFNAYLSQVQSNFNFVNNIKDLDSGTSPEEFKKKLTEESGGRSYTSEDVQRFVNSVDSLTLSFLMPYVNFAKPVKDKVLRLNLEDINRYATRRFVEGFTANKGQSGRGSTGQGSRERPGGIGIRSLNLEYLVNQESGYLFNLYKISAEIFFDSMEDVIMQIPQEGQLYTPIDVLIASSEDIHKYLLKDGTNTIVSGLYRTFIEVGYVFDKDIDNSFEKARNRWAEIVGKKSGLSFDTFIALMEKMKFVIEAHLYKWVWDVNETGNIILKLEYYGSDRGVGATQYANVLCSNELIEKYKSLNYAVATAGKDSQTETARTAAQESAKNNLDKFLEEAKIASLAGVFFALTSKRGHALNVPSSALEIDFSKNSSSLFGLLNLMFLRKEGAKVVPLSVAYKSVLFMYDFQKMFKNEASQDSQTTVERGSTNANFQGTNSSNVPIVGIPFFYLGELIDYFAQNAFYNLTRKNQDGSVFLPPGSKMKIYMGYINLMIHTLNKYEKITLPISAIPISWDFFLNWWTNTIKRNANLMYKFEEFLSDFFGYFFTRALGSSDDFGLKNLEIGCHVVMKPAFPQTENTPRELIFYIYIVDKQNRKPITFYIGNRYGILKNCKFAVEQDTYLSSYAMATTVEGTEPENNLQNQRAIYNIDLQFFGNCLITPGMLVQIVPTISGASMDENERFKNLYDLGIGGFYNVVSSKVQFSPGKFETSIHAKYYAKPDARHNEYSSGPDFSRADINEALKSHNEDQYLDLGIDYNESTKLTPPKDIEFTNNLYYNSVPEASLPDSTNEYLFYPMSPEKK